jgi:hypothetical protein
VNIKRSDALEFQLRVTKEKYSVGEPIEVILLLTNRSDTPLTVNKRMGFNPGHMGEGSWEVRFNVTFPPGKRLVIGTLINPVSLEDDDFTILAPGREISSIMTLTRFYWMELPGTYTVTATYHNSDDGRRFGLSAWTGDIASNPIHFKVTE